MQHRDEQGIAEALTSHYRDMIGRARRILRSELDAEDAVQEVMLAVLRAPHILAGVERLGAWLLTLVHRRCVDIIRANMRRREIESDDEVTEFFARAEEAEPRERDERVRVVQDAIGALPEALRLAFVENALDGLTFREMSERSGIPMGTLMARKKRAVDRIRAYLQQRGHM